MKYREIFYKNYVSGHTQNVYGSQTLEKIQDSFPIWKSYFSRFLPRDKSAKILDLGSGAGGFIYWLRSIGFDEVVGVDVSEEQVREAEKLGIPNVSKKDALSFLRENKDSYNLIVARDFIEHFSKSEIVEIIPAIFDSLKKGGVLIIQTVNAESWFGSRLRYADFTHEVAFTESSIKQLLSVFGFFNTEVFPMRPVIRGLVSFLRYCVWLLFELNFHIYLIAATGYQKGIFTQDLLAVARKS